MRTTREIADFVGGALQGDAERQIHGVGSLEQAGAGALAYAETGHLDRVAASGASCVLVPAGDFPELTVIVVDNPRVAFARAAQWLLPATPPFQGVHPTALIHDEAALAAGVAVGAWTLIERGAQVGARTVVYPGCYIGAGCRIGADCTLYPHAVLYPDVELGDRVVVHAGAVLGADGFGFVFDGSRHVKIPQVGRVEIGSDVELGAHACVDRGTLDETAVEAGAKLDNLCHVGHNVRIGAHTVIAAQTGIAGSSRIGSYATVGGQVGIGDHCRIDDHALIGSQGGVVSRKRVPAGEIYWGTPARPLKDVKAQVAHVGRLPRMAEELKRLQAEVAELRARLDRRGQESAP